MYYDAKFAGSSSVSVHVEMMDSIGMVNSSVAGAAVADAQRIFS